MNFDPVIDILKKTEESRVNGLENACDLLHTRNAATELLKQIVRKPAFAANSLELLKKIAPIVQDCQDERSTDWPFENFWCDPRDPLEPRHSRLLGYFINPRENRKYGKILLEKFIFTIKEKLKPLSGKEGSPELTVDDKCEVSCEKGRIDIQITRGKDNKKLLGRYAVIIENKVHPDTAPYQDSSLWCYVQHVKTKWEFKDDEIYVLYMPLIKGDPSPKSLCDPNGLKPPLDKSKFVAINFDKDIRNWLTAALRCKKRLPEARGVYGCMRDNLRHYLNMINFLLRQEKEQKMNSEIFAELEKAKKNKKLPPLAEVVSLREAAEKVDRLKKAVEDFERCYKVFSGLEEICKDLSTCHPERNVQRVRWNGNDEGESIEIESWDWNADYLGVSLGRNPTREVVCWVHLAGTLNMEIEIGVGRIGKEMDKKFRRLCEEKNYKPSDPWYHTIDNLSFENGRVSSIVTNMNELYKSIELIGGSRSGSA